jgi:tetrapyrrole methylase family protein / MazG family protein
VQAIRKIYHAFNGKKIGVAHGGGQFVNNKIAGEKFAELLDTMAQLRGQPGCPWDKEQTHESLRSFLLEESHELLDALAGGDSPKIREELGDLLHQIVFHCQIAKELETFTAADVIADLQDKMRRRHPHVFSEKSLSDSSAVLKQWARIKATEAQGHGSQSALGNLPKSMPALARAQTITERASRVGFDWPEIAPVWEKIEEELTELRKACAAGNKPDVAAELGDLFFSLVNLARFLDVQAEDTLGQATERFIKRFGHIENKLRGLGKTPATSSLAEMDRLWNEAKALERREKSRA